MIPDDGPDFSSPFSKPVSGAVQAFRLPPERQTPIVEPAVTHGLSDAGQAKLFAERNGDRFRHDHSRKNWWVNEGHYWRPDRDGEVKRAVINQANDLYLSAQFETNLKTREAVAKFAIQQESRRKVEDVLELAKVMAPIAITGNEWNQDGFALCAPNDTIDLRTGLPRSSRASDHHNLHTTATFNPFATCPRWDCFLREVFIDDDLVTYIQRAVGYSATADMREQVVFLAFGHGANGKSVFLETIAYVLGEYAYACPFQTFEASQRSEIGADVAALAGRRFVRSSETNTRSRFNEARLKALSGGDRMNARHLYGNPFEFHPVCKIWLGVNHKPAVADDSFGFWRRMHTIPFTQTFAGTADDKNLRDTLRAEASGILNWIISGSLAWQAHGLNPPAQVLAARDEYQRENDPLAEFLDDTCVLLPSAHVPAAVLFGAYTGWCDRQGIRDGASRTRFGKLVGARFESRHTEGGKVYRGIGLKG